MKKLHPLVSMTTALLVTTLLTCVPASAVMEKTNLQNKEFTVDSTTIIFADPDNGPSYSGGSTGSQNTDTRTEEEKAEDERIALREELENKIHEVMDKINSGEAGDEAWDEVPDFGDWVTDGGWNGGSDVDLGDVSLPDWALPDNPDFDGWESGEWELPDIDDLWDQFLTDKGITPNIPNQPSLDTDTDIDMNLPDGSISGNVDPDKFDPDMIITGLEITEPVFSGIAACPTSNGIITVDQQTVPIGTLVALAATNANLALENQISTTIPIEIPEISITDHDEPEDTLIDIPITEIKPGDLSPETIDKVEQLPFDYEKWLDEFKEWIWNQYLVKPGENSQVTEDQFITNPSIDNAADMFPGLIEQGKLPGTDIDVGFVENNEDLYSLLFLYMSQLKELNMVHTNITKFTIYQMSDYDLQTIHISNPTSEFQWVVSGPGGQVDKTTNSPYAKLLFRAAGTYDVDIYNTQEVYRNNKVSGKKSEVWVLSNGGFFDGLIVYENTTQFEAFISEDIGPTMEQIPMVDDSFTAEVTPSMLNSIQLIDQYGNIRTPTDGFMTERE